MAKFRGSELYLDDGQRVRFGDNQQANIRWQDDLLIDSTISGVDPVYNYHLSTKNYVDTEISSVSSSIITDHGGLSGLDDDDHTQYTLVDGSRGFTAPISGVDPTQPDHLATMNYVDTEISALSSGIVLDHGELSGLDDDDHPQYALLDGSRGFTATVSGVTPTQDYHLATKGYVDSGGIDRKGRQTINSGSSVVTVNFSDIGHTNYTVNVTLSNTSDSPPSIYAFIVSAIASDNFTVTLMGDTDSANYVLHWSILED